MGITVFSRRQFWISGQRCTVGIAIGTMLLPEVRGIAGLVAMSRQAYATCRERGYQRLYAFPNDPAYKVRCALLGWRALPKIVELDGPLPSDKPDVASTARVWREMPANLDFDCFEPAGPDSIQSAPSARCIKWRFFDRPGGEYVLHTLGQIRRYMDTR